MKSYSRRSASAVFAAALLAACPLTVRAATTRTWINGSGNWNDPTHWSPADVPDTDDNVNLQDPGATITYIQPSPALIHDIHLGTTGGTTLLQTQDTLTAFSLTIGGGGITGTYDYSGGSLNVQANMTVNSGGTFTGISQFNVFSNLSFAGGTMSGTGETVIQSNGQLNFTGAAVNAAIYRTIRNQGTTTWSNTGSVGGSGTFINEGTFNITNDGQGNLAFSLPSFVNQGTVSKLSGTHTSFGGVTTFDNQGTVVVATGTKLSINGTIPQQTTTSLTGGGWYVAGELVCPSGAATIDTINSGASVRLDGASSLFAKIDALATNNGTFEVTNGRQFTTVGALSNSGTLRVGSGAKLTVTTSLAQQVGSTLTAGIYNVFSGELALPGGPITTNQADFRLAGTGICTAIDTISDNQGTFKIGGGKSFTAGTFNNSGQVWVEPMGSLFLSNGGTQSGIFDSGPLNVVLSFNGGTHTFNNPTLNGQITIAGSVTITASSDWTGADTTIWSGGTLTGAGSVLVPNGRQFRINAGASHLLNTTVENSGLTTWQGSAAVSGPGTFNNLVDGTFEITSGGGPAFAVAQFNNAGAVVKSASFMAANFGGAMAFNNTGSVEVLMGSINISGTIAQATTSTLTGGTWKATGGTLSLNSAPPLTTIGAAATVQLSGSASVFSRIDSLADNQGSFTITNDRDFITLGALTNSASLTIGPSSVLTMAGTLKDTGTLSINATGAIDLTNQKMITTDAIGVWNGSAYTGITGLIDAGRITTTSTFAGLTTVGVASADDTNFVGGMFGGVSVSSGDVLLAYTLAGDANLDQEVDADDYFAIDSNYNKLAAALGYSKGDFNYDGAINGDDYLLIDSSFSGQGGFPPSLAASRTAGVTAVPEPTSAASLAMLALAAGRLRRRRRDRRSAS